MKYLVPLSLLAALASAQDGCGFPDGPDCVSLGQGANGLEQFADPDGCCLLPIRCGNGDGGERCERVSTGSGNNNNNNNNGNDNGNSFNFNSVDNVAATANDDNCGFPNGPDCESLGDGANGLEQFADDGCCLLPFRCGNGDGGERCERVPVKKRVRQRARRHSRGKK